jgi:hypothetical protein
MAEEPKLLGDRSPHFFRKAGGGYIRPKFKREALEKLAASVPKLGDGSGQSYALALVILEYVFGFKWVERHILDEPKNGFLARVLGSEGGSSVVVHRVRDLAELVLNLMPVRGVEAPLDLLSGGAIEPGYAELEVGKLLLTRGIEFRFIWPSGVKGESFDLEVTFPNGVPVCADTKCKAETEVFSKNGMLNTLNGARKRNLPKGYPGMVVVKIPQVWHESSEIMAAVLAVCNEFLRDTKRIVCVEIYSSMVELRDNVIHYWLKGTEVQNNRHDYDRSLDWRLLTDSNTAAPVSPNGWWRLTDFFEAQNETNTGC